MDNKLTNYVENKILNCLLVNDIDDHSLIFVICDCNYRNRHLVDSARYRCIRSDDTINALKNDLTSQTWEVV